MNEYRKKQIENLNYDDLIFMLKAAMKVEDKEKINFLLTNPITSNKLITNQF